MNYINVLAENVIQLSNDGCFAGRIKSRDILLFSQPAGQAAPAKDIDLVVDEFVRFFGLECVTSGLPLKLEQRTQSVVLGKMPNSDDLSRRSVV